MIIHSNSRVNMVEKCDNNLFCNQHYESVIEMFQIPKYLSSALHQCVFVLPTAAAVLSMGQKQTRPPKLNFILRYGMVGVFGTQICTSFIMDY